MIYVIATIQLADGKLDEFIEALRDNLPNVRAEDGCIEYQPTIDLETDFAAQPDVRPNVVTMLEKWESLAALRAHLAAPHMLAYRERVKDCVGGVSLQILETA